MPIKAETRTATVKGLQKLAALVTPDALPLADHVELAVINHQLACSLWLTQQRDWGTALHDGRVRSHAAVEDFIWQCAAGEDFMQGITREFHAAAFADLVEGLEGTRSVGPFVTPLPI
jgi:hypothetical protein